MQLLTDSRGNALASAMLILLAFGAAPDRAQSQDTMAAATRGWEWHAAQAQRVRAEQMRGMERSRAHAQMPSTMYASTPDPSFPPHPFPLDVVPKNAPERSAPPGWSARSAMRQTHRIGLFPSAANALGRQGFARVINHSESDGEVTIDAYDDDGAHYGPLTLAMGAGETVHFNSDDLEEGNAGKGLEGATGPPGSGDWRLELSSTLELEVLSYIRTEDGFLTSMHDFVARSEGGQHRVPIFNPARNSNQVSRLRLINSGDQDTEVRIEGIDDAGQSPGAAVVLSLEGGTSRTLSARELEAGTGVSGGLGTGKGKWRLVVSSDEPIEVLNTLSTPTGHLTNLSTVPGPAGSGDGGATATHRIGLFPSAANALGRQGFARVINRSESDGEVTIDAWDDDGSHYGPLTLAIDAGETVHFNSADLEEGNAGKGLDGATGPPGKGNWRLELSSALELQVLSYIRTEDGFLTSMHDFVARTGAGQHRVATFNPGRNSNQVSRLRLINPGAGRTEVRIEGIDDEGQSPGSAVVLSLGGGMSRTLSARDLETGTGVSGGLGTGKGKWQLVVSADEPIEVLNTLSTPTGHLTNLSTVPGPAVASETAADVFREHISEPVVQGKCIACHVEGGVSGNTRLVFVPTSDPDHEEHNFKVIADFLEEEDDGARYVLNKIQGVAHGGGVQVAAGTPEFTHVERFLRLLGEEVVATPLTPQTLFDKVTMAPWRKTLRRAALIFTGRNPTEAEYAAVAEGGEGALRATIRGLMSGPEFHEFLIRASNDRLLTNRRGTVIDHHADFLIEFSNEAYRRLEAESASGNRQYFYNWNDRVQHGARRAPLELIAHVVENDLPYTEILTADYIMANPMAAMAYGASTQFEDPEDPHEFKPSRIAAYYRHGPGFESEYDPVVGLERIVDPGPLSTEYPHAGILNTAAFLVRYPSTATNRNRARSRWTYYHFLGLDIEKSASRTTDPVALADTNNPTLYNPACTVCHRVLDPVAGTFQNYGDEGWYKDQWGGMDSLDELYKYSPSGREDVSVRSRSRAGAVIILGSRYLFANRSNELGLKNPRTFDGDRKLHIGLGEVVVRDESGDAVNRYETRNVVSEADCGRSTHDGYKLWDCHEPLVLPLTVPRDGVYRIGVEAWVFESGDLPATLQVWMPGPFYRQGDTWYRDMRLPGFSGELAQGSDGSVQWLARKIVSDGRFAEATVKFWWPALMGSEVTEPPAYEEDVDFEGLLLAANAQGAEVELLARKFRSGFHGRLPFNLKDLLVEIVLSKWFRADAMNVADPVRQDALRHAGARRLLTPEELARKTASLTGVQWGRRIGYSCPYSACDDKRPSALTEEFRLLYGGIDSYGVSKRARNITSVMAGVGKRNAAVVSCPIVMRELYLLPDSERRLFAGIDRFVTPSRSPDTIRSKLVELHEKLVGVEVTPHSPDVESAYRLFVDVLNHGRQAHQLNFRSRDCYWNWRDDLFFLEGILDSAIEWHENEHGGRYRFSEHATDFMESVDWSDPYYAAQAWAVVLAYLLTDYRYLYL